MIPLTKESLEAIPRRVTMRDALSDIKMDITDAEHDARIDYVMGLGLPSLSLLRDMAPPGARVMICGGGPSIEKSLPAIKKAKDDGFIICALNMTHDWLIRHGIKPHFATMLDPNERVAGYQKPTEGVRYILGTTVHPSVWQRFREAGIRPFWYVPITHGVQHTQTMRRYPESNPIFISGPTTVGTRAIYLKRFMGWQTIDLAGFDSCYAPGFSISQKLYAYNKPHIWHDAREGELVSKTTGDSLVYVSNNSMARQIVGFSSMIQSMNDTETNGRVGGVRLIVHGDGAIPWMAWKDGGPDTPYEHADPESMFRKYGTAKRFNYDKGIAA